MSNRKLLKRFSSLMTSTTLDLYYATFWRYHQVCEDGEKWASYQDVSTQRGDLKDKA